MGLPRCRDVESMEEQAEYDFDIDFSKQVSCKSLLSHTATVVQSVI